MKTLILSLLLVSCNICFAQQIIPVKLPVLISPENKTYFTVDYSNVPDMIKWEEEDEYTPIYFRADSIPRSEGVVLKIKTKKYRKLAGKNFTPFLLDTASWNGSSYVYFANVSYFKWVNGGDARFPGKEKKIVAQLKIPFKANKKSVKQLFRLLMSFGVINTYDHLNSELIVTNIFEDKNRIEITYECMYHICTSECFDPQYAFKLQFDKKSKEISILP